MCEDLLKEMKEDTSLATMLNIAQISEGTIQSEELSKQYLDTIKVSNKQIDSVWKPRSKSGSRNRSCSTSCGGNCGSKHPPRRCKAFGKSVMVVANLIILSQCADPGIDRSLKAKGMLTLTIHMLPTNLLVVSKIRIRIKVKIDPIMISMK